LILNTKYTKAGITTFRTLIMVVASKLPANIAQVKDYFDEFATMKCASEPPVFIYLSKLEFYKYVAYILDFFDKPSAKAVLDVGCGAGQLMNQLLSLNSDIEIVGIDISINQLLRVPMNVSQEKWERVNLILCDIKNLPFRKEVFDGATLIDVIHHLTNFEQLVDLPRVVKPEGRFFVDELVINNPFIFFGRKLYGLVPSVVREKIPNIGPVNSTPEILLFSSRRLSEIMEWLGFEIIEKKRRSLFLLVLAYFKLIPGFKKIFSSLTFLLAMAEVEQKIIRYTPLKFFCNEITLKCFRQRRSSIM